MYYDLHIHSALSPCADNYMTVNNIVNMAYIKGLELIAITDHNSLKQLSYLDKIIHSPIVNGKIDYLYGVEIQTIEDIHVLAYFKKNTSLKQIQNYLDQHLIKSENDVSFYGNELIFNEVDEVIGEEKYLLLNSLDLDIKTIIDDIHKMQGICVLAHVFAKRYGCYEYFKDLPQTLHFDGVEVQSLKEIKKAKDILKNDHLLYLINSDAHTLEDINEPVHQIDINQINSLFGEYYG